MSHTYINVISVQCHSLVLWIFSLRILLQSPISLAVITENQRFPIKPQSKCNLSSPILHITLAVVVAQPQTSGSRSNRRDAKATHFAQKRNRKCTTARCGLHSPDTLLFIEIVIRLENFTTRDTITSPRMCGHRRRPTEECSWTTSSLFFVFVPFLFALLFYLRFVNCTACFVSCTS